MEGGIEVPGRGQSATRPLPRAHEGAPDVLCNNPADGKNRNNDIEAQATTSMRR